MRGLYSDVAQVTDYIARDLVARFPDAEAELFLNGRGGAGGTRYKGNIKDMLLLLRRFCSGFPGAQVRFEPEHPYGMVASLVGQVSPRSNDRANTVPNPREQPRALLTLTAVGGRKIEVGRR
ncbi:MAG TPA: hypothetical protein HPP77_10830 [Candidatus Hydrogenedentes bacterium]|nr:hypothetical protein [Candidatus Hydrogenedentota bacterium]